MEQDNELYWQEMFAWYEEHEPDVVAGLTANNESKETKSKHIRFEDKLALHGLDLGDLTFNEIIKGDLQTILEVRGIKPCNNKDYNNYGGVA